MIGHVVAGWATYDWRDKQRSLILTTHSMDEANTVCNRIGILVNGRLATIGSSQELKSMHGKNYQLEIKLVDVGTKVCICLLRFESFCVAK